MSKKGEMNVTASIVKQKASYWFGVLELIFFSFIFIMPLYWMFRTALMSVNQAFERPTVWFPNPIIWDAYDEVMWKVDFGKYVWNTLFYCFVPIVGVLFSCPMVAYSLTKIPWKGGNVIFTIILFTMMIPWTVTMIPVYSIWANLGFTNSYVPLLLPTFFGSAYYIYLMRQYMKSLPDSVMEAARIDGASEFRILYTIVYPMCKTVCVTIAVLVFMAHWNDYTGPMLYLKDSSKFTLSYGMAQFGDPQANQWTEMMAASTVSTAPLIVLFFFAQKYFLNGISTTSGLK